MLTILIGKHIIQYNNSTTSVSLVPLVWNTIIAILLLVGFCTIVRK